MPVPAAPEANATQEEQDAYAALCLEHINAGDLPSLRPDFSRDLIPEALRDAWDALRNPPKEG